MLSVALGDLEESIEEDIGLRTSLDDEKIDELNEKAGRAAALPLHGLY